MTDNPYNKHPDSIEYRTYEVWQRMIKEAKETNTPYEMLWEEFETFVMASTPGWATHQDADLKMIDRSKGWFADNVRWTRPPLDIRVARSTAEAEKRVLTGEYRYKRGTKLIYYKGNWITRRELATICSAAAGRIIIYQSVYQLLESGKTAEQIVDIYRRKQIVNPPKQEDDE